MSNRSAKVLGALMGTTMVAGMGMAYAAPALADEAGGSQAAGQEARSESSTVARSQVSVADVQGEFAFNQDEITPNETIRGMFQKAVSAVCSQLPRYAAGDPDSWIIEVKGDVKNAFSATLGELSEGDDVETKVMTCACSANQAGGGAIANAEVTGVPVRELIVRAGIGADVNTVTFASADGTRSSLPLSYVLSHGAVVAFEINGEELAASVGGTNQLWLSGSAGAHFMRDIVSVDFACQDEPPAEPDLSESGMMYTNRPNVSASVAG